MTISPPRRLMLAAFALMTAALLLRTQISSALVTRGDTLSYWGLQQEARNAYARALVFDPANDVAADRFAFNAVTSHERAVIADAVSVLNRALDREPYSSVLRMDRAMAYHQLGNYRPAIADFFVVAKDTRDPRALMFAAFDERRLRRLDASRRLLRQAVALDPDYLPAVRAFAKAQR